MNEMQHNNQMSDGNRQGYQHQSFNNQATHKSQEEEYKPVMVQQDESTEEFLDQFQFNEKLIEQFDQNKINQLKNSNFVTTLSNKHINQDATFDLTSNEILNNQQKVILQQQFKKSHVEVLQSGKGHVPSPLRHGQYASNSFLVDETTSNLDGYMSAQNVPGPPKNRNQQYSSASRNSRMSKKQGYNNNWCGGPSQYYVKTEGVTHTRYGDFSEVDDIEDSGDYDLDRIVTESEQPSEIPRESKVDLEGSQSSPITKQRFYYDQFLNNNQDSELHLDFQQVSPMKQLRMKNIKFKKQKLDQVNTKESSNTRNSKQFIKIKLESSDQKLNLRTFNKNHKKQESQASQYQIVKQFNRYGDTLGDRGSNKDQGVGSASEQDQEIIHDNEMRQEVLLDQGPNPNLQPRLKIFRFKNLKTSLDQNQDSITPNQNRMTLKSNEKDQSKRINEQIIVENMKSKNRNRTVSKKAASRYDNHQTSNIYDFDDISDESDLNDDEVDITKKSNCNQRINYHQTNKTFSSVQGTTSQTHNKQTQEAKSLGHSPSLDSNHQFNMHNVRTNLRNAIGAPSQTVDNNLNNKKYKNFNVNDEDDLDDILSNSQISRIHCKFNLKRFSQAVIDNKQVNDQQHRSTVIAHVKQKSRINSSMAHQSSYQEQSKMMSNVQKTKTQLQLSTTLRGEGEGMNEGKRVVQQRGSQGPYGTLSSCKSKSPESLGSLKKQPISVSIHKANSVKGESTHKKSQIKIHLSPNQRDTINQLAMQTGLAKFRLQQKKFGSSHKKAENKQSLTKVSMIIQQNKVKEKTCINAHVSPKSKADEITLKYDNPIQIVEPQLNHENLEELIAYRIDQANSLIDKNFQRILTDRIKNINPKSYQKSEQMTPSQTGTSNQNPPQNLKGSNLRQTHAKSQSKMNKLNCIQEEGDGTLGQSQFQVQAQTTTKKQNVYKKKFQLVGTSSNKKLSQHSYITKSSGKIPKFQSNLIQQPSKKSNKDDEFLQQIQNIELKKADHDQTHQTSAHDTLTRPKNQSNSSLRKNQSKLNKESSIKNISQSKSTKNLNSQKQLIYVGAHANQDQMASTAVGATIATCSQTHASSGAGRTNSSASASGLLKSQVQQHTQGQAPLYAPNSRSSIHPNHTAKVSNLHDARRGQLQHNQSKHQMMKSQKTQNINPNGLRISEKGKQGGGSSQSVQGMAQISKYSHQKPSMSNASVAANSKNSKTSSNAGQTKSIAKLRGHQSGKSQTVVGFSTSAEHHTSGSSQNINMTMSKKQMAYSSSQTMVRNNQPPINQKLSQVIKSDRSTSDDNFERCINSQRSSLVRTTYNMSRGKSSNSRMQTNRPHSNNQQYSQSSLASGGGQGQGQAPPKKPQGPSQSSIGQLISRTIGVSPTSSHLSRLLCSTKQAQHKQKIVSKKENTKKIILKNQEIIQRQSQNGQSNTRGNSGTSGKAVATPGTIQKVNQKIQIRPLGVGVHTGTTQSSSAESCPGLVAGPSPVPAHATKSSQYSKGSKQPTIIQSTNRVKVQQKKTVRGSQAQKSVQHDNNRYFMQQFISKY